MTRSSLGMMRLTAARPAFGVCIEHECIKDRYAYWPKGTHATHKQHRAKQRAAAGRKFCKQHFTVD